MCMPGQQLFAEQEAEPESLSWSSGGSLSLGEARAGCDDGEYKFKKDLHYLCIRKAVICTQCRLQLINPCELAGGGRVAWLRLPGAIRAHLSGPRCLRGFSPPSPLVNGAQGYTQWLGVSNLAVFPLTSLSFTLFGLTMGSSSGTPSQPSARSCFYPLNSEAEGHLPSPGCPQLTPLGSEWIGGVKSSCAEEL